MTITLEAPDFALPASIPAHWPHECALDNDVTGVTLVGSSDIDTLLGLAPRTTAPIVTYYGYTKNAYWPPAGENVRVPRPARLVSGRPVWLLEDVEAFAAARSIKLDAQVLERLRASQTLPGAVGDVESVTELARATHYQKSGKAIGSDQLVRKLQAAGVTVVKVAGMAITCASAARRTPVESNREGLLIWQPNPATKASPASG